MRHPILKYSVILLICFLFSACSSKKVTQEELARTTLTVVKLKEAYGEVPKAIYASYFDYLLSRFSYALMRVGSNSSDVNLILLDTKEPLAFSAGMGELVISKGMISRLKSEAELAFVLAHELGHQILGHVKYVDGELRSEYNFDLEIAADKFAVGLMSAAGYDPHAASYGLIHAYGGITSHDIMSRGQIMDQEIESSAWEPPGTIDRRDFQRLKLALR